MSRTALPTLRRTLVAVSLVATLVLAFVGLLLQPEFPDDNAEYVRLLAESPTAALGLQLFAFAQLFWAIGFVGLAHATVHRARVTGTIGAVSSGLGAFGHAVFAGASLVGREMAMYATETGDAAAAVAAADASQGGAFLPYLAFGLLGTVLGVVFTGIAMLRSRIAPVWVPIALLVWVVVEFGLPNFLSGVWITYASMMLGLIAFTGAAIAILRGGRGAWTTALESDESGDPTVARVDAARA
ncbi:hypothetical protein [Agromyces mangrovi Wang et al. 2018]|uniref:hypothetical protein n=1 Tax=Agromyces mangrovi TaxID=1858653 RepID=UPI002573DC60|nr:hypothetical protein [Agromyces mangrovi]BDZ63136.1 hypothetical protein GCM10025877_00740 [Agromyces mangrovi]